MSLLGAWQNFYIIVGSSSGALIGLTFVTVTLIGDSRLPAAPLGIATFNTPTVVHFGAVLLVSALLSAPWPTLLAPAIILGLGGLTGALYTLVVTRRMVRMVRLGREIHYTPVLEDWLCHVVGPLGAYAALVAAAFLLVVNPVVALFTLGAAMVLFLIIGIHNAWDLVTFMTMKRVTKRDKRTEQERSAAESGDTFSDAVDGARGGKTQLRQETRSDV